MASKVQNTIVEGGRYEFFSTEGIQIGELEVTGSEVTEETDVRDSSKEYFAYHSLPRLSKAENLFLTSPLLEQELRDVVASLGSDKSRWIFPNVF